MSGSDRLRGMLGAIRNVVVFTGAGISTESGIPDFRSPGGIWSRHQPIYFEDFLASEAKSREYWRLKFLVDRDIRNAKPNTGHLAVARLVRSGKVGCVITQNVDGLHQASGGKYTGTPLFSCVSCFNQIKVIAFSNCFAPTGRPGYG